MQTNPAGCSIFSLFNQVLLTPVLLSWLLIGFTGPKMLQYFSKLTAYLSVESDAIYSKLLVKMDHGFRCSTQQRLHGARVTSGDAFHVCCVFMEVLNKQGDWHRKGRWDGIFLVLSLLICTPAHVPSQSFRVDRTALFTVCYRRG